MQEGWGPPPGTVFRRADEIYVAGKLYGNVFVMIQPPHGFGENPLTVYHSGDLIPTHHYLGAYRWLRDVFRESRSRKRIRRKRLGAMSAERLLRSTKRRGK